MFRLRLTAKLVTASLVLVLAISAAIALSVFMLLEKDAERQIHESLDRYLRIAHSELLHGGKTAEIIDGQLVFGTLILNGNEAFADRIGDIIGDGTVTVFQGDTRIATTIKGDDGKRAVGTKLAQGPAYDTVFGQGKTYYGETVALGVEYVGIYEPIKDAKGKTIGVLFIGDHKEDFYEALMTIEKTLVGVVGGLILVIGLIVMVAGKAGVRPLVNMSNIMGVLAEGNLDVAIPDTNRADEIGDMARAVAVFKDNALEARRLQREAEEAQAREEERKAEERRREENARREKAERDAQLAAEQKQVVEGVAAALNALVEGDLTYRLNEPFPPAYEGLRQNLNQTSERLEGIMTDVLHTIEVVSSAVREISQGSDDLAHRTSQQASNVQETVAAMEEITATVKMNADNSQAADRSAGETRRAAEQGGSVASNAISAMREIEASSSKISEIIGVIDEITFQTNLLALNASVEAARAGEAGKGFAVVASEVRTLAQRSADAAREIKSLIQTSTSHVQNGVGLVNQAGDTLTGIADSVKTVAQLIGEIAHASQEQAIGLDQINRAVTDIDAMTQQNAALVEESSAAAKSVSDETERLVQLVSFFKLSA